ncbi:MAG TPA: porin PorA family protein [Micromonosporaceae bacterium]
MRARTVLGFSVGAVGVLLLAAAAMLYWVVLPSQAKLPSDTNTTRLFNGTAKLLLNPQAVASGNLTNAIVTNTPVAVTRTVKVLATDGNAAEVSDARTLTTAATKQVIGKTEATYAVDRKSLEPAGQHPASWQVIDQQGLTVSWPIGAKKQDYTGWVNETQTTTPLRYLREESHAGVNTYVYQAKSAAATIKDPQVLATLPKALPVTALGALAKVLPIPADLQAQLAALLPRLTEPVPLTYTYESTSTYWVEPTSGIVVDVQREEIRKAGLSLPGGASVPASIPVYDVTTAVTQDSQQAAAQDAQDARNTIDFFGKTLPLALLVLGALALIGAVILIVTARRGGRRMAAASGSAGPSPG